MKVSVASINLNDLKTTYKEALPKMSGSSSVYGRFFSSYKYLVGADGNTFYKNLGSFSIGKRTTYVVTSDLPARTCCYTLSSASA
jgi:hypothetical protein